MVFPVCQLQLEALKLDTCSKGESRTMTTAAFSVRNFHFICPSETVASSNVDVVGEKYVGSQNEMVGESLAPVVEPTHGELQPEWRVENAFRHS